MSRFTPLLISLVLSGLVLSWLIWLNSTFGLPFWGTRNDYTELALAQAVKTDLWVSGSPEGKRTYFQVFHPGIPFQATSWLAWRAASRGEGKGDPISRFRSFLKNPESFAAATRWSALAITGFSVLFAGLVLRRINQSPLAIIASISFFTYWPALDYSAFLGNEVFALFVGVLAAGAAFRALGNSARWWDPLLFGACAALAYLNKLNYIAYFPGFFCAIGLLWLLKAHSFGRVLSTAGLAMAGFAVMLVGAGLCWLGVDGFKMMAKHHFGVLTHTGIYEGGSAGVVEAAGFIRALRTFWDAENLFALFAIGVAVGAIALTFGRQNRNPQLRSWVIYLVSTAILCALATFKHFGWHYFIATVVPISFLAGVVLTHGRWWLRAPWFGLCAVLVFQSTQKTISHRRGTFQAGIEDLRVAREVVALPLEKDEVRVWSYRVSAPQYLSSFISAMIDSPRIAACVFEEFPRERTTAPWYNWSAYDTKQMTPLNQVPWRYAIIDINSWNVPKEQRFPLGPEDGTAKLLMSTPRFVVLERAAVTSAQPPE